jgi:hypothetical protein
MNNSRVNLTMVVSNLAEPGTADPCSWLLHAQERAGKVHVARRKCQAPATGWQKHGARHPTPHRTWSAKRSWTKSLIRYSEDNRREEEEKTMKLKTKLRAGGPWPER